MIKLEHCVLPSPEQMAFVIEGMRNPMNSWIKSDSETYAVEASKNGFDFKMNDFSLGKADHQLMLKLAQAGTEHRKYMRMMPVYLRITAPLYWWKEFDTYKIGTVSNSCSTMHKIMDKEFTIDDFSCEHLDPSAIDILKITVDALNAWRYGYINDLQDSDDEEWNYLTKKDLWWQMIQLLPSSYNQTRNVSMNYEVLCDIYRQRKNHKLDEWRTFCGWIEHLPYSELICQTIDEDTTKVSGWRPISEYDRKLYDWVLVKTFDVTPNNQIFECIPEVAELREDNKWYTKTGEVLWWKPRYFFDMQQLDK